MDTVCSKIDRKLLLNTCSWRQPDSFFTAVLRSPWYRTIGVLIAEIHAATHRFYAERSFSSIPLPITCHSVSSPFGLGSDSLPVSVELFDTSLFLADSMQFHLEYLLRQGFEGLYYLMPTFRGEDPDARHLNQFFHSEMEMKGRLEDVMRTVEEYIRYCTNAVYQKYRDRIEQLNGGIQHIEHFLNQNLSIPRITFEETKTIVPRKQPYYIFLDGQELSLTGKGEAVLLEYFQGPVWLTHPLLKAVPFYQASMPDEEHACCADLLMGIGEIVGCGQRHKTAEETLAALISHRVDPQEYDWYVRMKQEAPIQTTGFGLGIERLLLWLLNHNDIRDIPLFNRLKGFESAP